MTRWYRIFGSNEVLPEPASLESQLGPTGTAHFAADNQGWYSAELTVASGPVLTLERFHVEEEGIRAELNSWAAFLESLAEQQPAAVPLMERVIQTRQLFTLSCPDEPAIQEFAVPLSQILARLTEGVYQVDGAGFYDPTGNLLVREA
jgi:hypothetical protein